MKNVLLLTLLSTALIYAMDREEKHEEAVNPVVFWQGIIGDQETVTKISHNKAQGTTLVHTINKPDNRMINMHIYKSQTGEFIETISIEQPWTMAQFKQARELFNSGETEPMRHLAERVTGPRYYEREDELN